MDNPKPAPLRHRHPATERPSHPALAAALMMIGIVVFLVLVSLVSVM